MKKFDEWLEEKLKRSKYTLTISNISLNQKRVDTLCKKLPEYPEISALKLETCSLKDSHAEQILELNQLRKLNLLDNQLTNKVAEFCSKNETLEYLNLSANKKITGGFFANYKNNSIQTLYLGRTQVGQLYGIVNNKALVNLHLNHNKFDDDDSNALDELKAHPTLQFLNLCSAEIKTESLTSLIKSQSSVLNHIVVDGAVLSKPTKKQLKEFVQKNLESSYYSLCDSLFLLNIEFAAPLIGDFLFAYSRDVVTTETLTKLSTNYFRCLAQKQKEESQPCALFNLD